MAGTTRGIDIPVRGNLSSIIQQAKELQQVLKKTLSPEDLAFNGLNRSLEQIIKKADQLGLTMNTAFSTSSGTKKFTKELTTLYNTLDATADQMKRIDVSQLFTTEEAQKVAQLRKESENLTKQLRSLKSEKIGGFFDTTADTQFVNIKKQIKSLSVNVSRMTFDDLSNKFRAAEIKISTDIEELNTKINNIGRVKHNFNELGDNLKHVLQEATSSAFKVSFDAEVSPEAVKRLKDFYDKYSSQYSDLFGGKNFKAGDFTGKDPGEIIRKETDSIKNAINDRIALINDKAKEVEEKNKVLQDALDILTNVNRNRKGTTADQKKVILAEQAERINTIFPDLLSDDKLVGRDIISKISKAKDILAETLKNNLVPDSSKLESLKTEMTSAITEIFSGLQINTTIGNKETFKNSLKQFLVNNGVSEEGIREIIKSISLDGSFDTVFDNIVNSIKNYLDNLNTTSQNSADIIENLKIQLKELQEASKEVNDASRGKDDAATRAEKELAKKRQETSNIERNALGRHDQEVGKAMSEAETAYINASNALEKYNNGLMNLESRQAALSNLQMTIRNWMGFYQVLNLTRSAVQEMRRHIEELDQVITQIAVVTNMSQQDLWGQIGQYSQIARQYGVAIKGVYEVSQIYYQQGLSSIDVMNLTTETLKMARIANLDYATSADYMTTAIRGFKMEMSDASHVTDVYSALAARTASDTEELATAISKTASSAEAVGSSFEATTAMLATMISVTRESATNIGTALKSVISRYGEMTTDPSKITDSEGEELSLNKVDKALQTIGITIHDVNGQFRDFDDVLLELAEHWDEIDKNSQRYIATIMAGNRQQSRFLALVGNVEEYKNALNIAMNADEASEVQTLKTLDSIDAKIERMRVTIQEFYTSTGLENFYKGILDVITNVIDAANRFDKWFGKFPGTALMIGFQAVRVIKNILSLIIASISTEVSKLRVLMDEQLANIPGQMEQAGRDGGQALVNAIDNETRGLGSRISNNLKNALSTDRAKGILGNVLSSLGVGLTMLGTNAYGASKTTSQDTAAGFQTLFGGLASGAAGALRGAKLGSAIPIPGGAIIGAALGGLIEGVPALSAAFNMLTGSIARNIELAQKRAEEAKKEALLQKDETNNLQQAVVKLQQLKDARYDSNDAESDYIDYMNQLADTYPELVNKIDLVGNKTIEVIDLEKLLADSRLKTAESTTKLLQAELDTAKERRKGLEKIDFSSYDNTLSGLDYTSKLTNMLQSIFENFGVDELVGNNGPLQGFIGEGINSGLFINESQRKIQLNNPDEQQLYQIAGTLFNSSMADDFFNITRGITPSKIRGQYTKESFAAYFSPFIAADFSNDTKSIIKKMQQIDSNISLDELTGVKDFKLDNFYTYAEWVEIIANTKEYIKKYNDYLDNNINNLNSSLNNSKLVEIIETDAKRSNIEDGKVISEYANFISQVYLASKNLTDSVGLDENKVKEDIKVFEEYAISNSNKMSDLINGLGDYSSFINQQDLFNFLDIFSLQEGSPIFEGIKNQYNEYKENLSKEIDEAIESSIEDDGDRQLAENIAALFTDEDSSLSGQFSGILLSSFSGYNKLLEDGKTVAATAYLKNIFDTLTYISSLGKNDANSLFSILNITDLRDTTSIDKAIKTINSSELDSKIIQMMTGWLTAFRDSIEVNVGLALQEMLGNSSDIAKDWSETFDKMLKPMSWPEIAKTAQEIYDASNGRIKSINALYEYNKDLNGWVLTQDAINELLDQVQEDQNEKLSDLSRRQEITRENLEGFLKIASVGGADFHFSSPTEVADQIKKVVDDEQVEKIDAAILQNIYNDYLKEFENNSELKLEDYLEQRKKDLETEYAASYQEFLNAYINNFLNQLTKLDFSKIATGQDNSATTLSIIKNALIALNDETITNPDLFARIIYEDLKKGNFTSFDDIFNFNGKSLISNSVKEATQKAYASQYTDALTDILTNEAQTWSIATKSLLEKLGINASNAIDAAVALLTNINSLLAKGEISLQQYNESYRQIVEKSLKTRAGGNTKAVSNFLTGNRDLSSFEELSNALNGNLNTYIDENGNLKGNLKNYLQYNNSTGSFDIINGQIKNFVNEIFVLSGEAASVTQEQYLEIYSSLIDKQISDINNRNINLQTAGQLERLGSAKVGDLLNVSYLSNDTINTLQQYGIQIIDGIAKITENSNLFGALSSISNFNTNSPEIQQAITKLKDTLTSIVSNWISLFSNGLNGSLSAEGRINLEQFARNSLGFEGKLDFTETAEGLKLSQKSATELYYALKQVDGLRATLVFDELADSLAKTNEHYKDMSDILARIKELEDIPSNVRTKQYEQELALAKEIAQVRATTEDSSFNFMNGAMPSGFQNPINYWNSIGQAFKSMNEAKETGLMDILDFYQIINEMNNLASIGETTFNILGTTIDGSAEAAAELIEKGLSTITDIDGEGIKVDLSKFGIDFKNGLSAMGKNFDDASKIMAKSQIKMLDGMIQLLETVVAMEKLGDIDVDKNGIFNLGDVFKLDENNNPTNEYTDQYKKYAADLNKQIEANEELKQAFEKVTIGEYTLKQLIQDATDGVKDIDISYELYFAALQALAAASKSEDYDLDNIGKSLQEIFNNAGFKGEVKVDGVSVVQESKIEAQLDISAGEDTTGFNLFKGSSAIEDALNNAINPLKEAIDSLKDEKLNNIATAFEKISAAAHSIMDIDWATMASNLNSLNAPTVPNVLNQGTPANDTSNPIVDINAKIKYLDKVTEEVLTSDSISRTIELVANAKSIQDALTNLSANVSLNGIFSGGFNMPLNAGTQTAGPVAKTAATPAITNPFANMGDVFKPIVSAFERVINVTNNSTPKVNNLSAAINSIVDTSQRVYNLVGAMNSINNWASGRIYAVGNAMNSIPDISSRMSSLYNSLFNLSKLNPLSLALKLNVDVSTSPTSAKGTITSFYPQSIGLLSFARGNAAALASGRKTQTLMGELGPELYVTNGHYFVAGQGGAEFVDLPDDAIVFNHLQTKKLLSNGAAGRGTAFTSVKNALAYSKGTSGPALASASAALNTLKQIRAMWQSMLNASMSDLGALAGSSGTKGGNGGGSTDKSIQTSAAYIAELDRWYNLLRQIEKIEEQINYEEKLRSKIESDRIINGEVIYESQKRSLAQLDQEISKNKELANLQKIFYDRRRSELASSPFGQIFTFNENGLMQYNDDSLGLRFLAELNAQNANGQTKYTAKEQYELLSRYGFAPYVRFTSSGEEIQMFEDGQVREEGYTEAVQAFWDRLDSWKDELDNLYDSYNTKIEDILDNETERNNLLQAIIDNQLELENQVVKAIEDREQKIIDEFDKNKQAIEDANEKFLNGLSQQLEKERKMYDTNQNLDDLNKMRRQLNILRRSGGSASQIRSLEQQISQQERNMYFDKQQEEIDSIQKASDLEIEKLNDQLNVMKESLEYQKENGLLWNEAYQIMSYSNTEIAKFISTHGKDWESKSEEQRREDLRKIANIAEQWTSYRDDNAQLNSDYNAAGSTIHTAVSGNDNHDWRTFETAMINTYGQTYWNGVKDEVQQIYNQNVSSGNPSKFIDVESMINAKYPDRAEVYQSGSNFNGSYSPNAQGGNSSANIVYNPEESMSYSFSGAGFNGSNFTGTFKDALSYFKNHSDSDGNFSIYWIDGNGELVEIYSGNKKLTWVEGSVSASGSLNPGRYRASYTGKSLSYLANFPGYSEGGLLNYTGLFAGHGTKTRPESVLTAEQTHILREDILGKQSTSLVSLLNTLRDYMVGTTVKNNTNTEAISIEHVELNMNVGSIANDYDARRAGANALEEIVRLARKSGAQGVRR